MPETDKCQLVIDQLEKDPSNWRGPKTVKDVIAFDTGIHLTRFIPALTWYILTDT